MTVNDYVLGLMAIISGLAITHMIGSVSELVAQRSRVKFDWLALTAASFVAYFILYGWWVTWASFHLRTGPLPFWRFLMPMASVTVLALAARTALPDQVPTTGLDLRERYATHGVWIWRGLLFSSGFATLGVVIRRMMGENLGQGASPWGFAGLILNLALLLILSSTKARRIHALLTPTLFVLFIAATILQPV